MASIKEASTIQENKSLAFVTCPVTFVMEKIGGYWKPIILFNLLSGPKRYSELKRSIPTITEKVLIQHLKQLESDHLVVRRSKPVVPPYVTYELSRSGKALRPVLYAMAEWAVANSGKFSKTFSRQMKDFPAA
ncbi:helix-turn-helix domain-containing protein [Flavitalea sp. BT771]|uniref:winged helix-turn-helix transcriptional regulator n=1 Tax=Flavitalea sp. BT771 TaxID=3063329 RepID=UPI0026E3AAF2|nr:helix-turn-helix domain-containing protein [Flavitalea sp. BT771]MDO6429085.1 helix-turn-helix domain-containing protein [Flavitalea sp. BT771]MDV6218787.1 helix-turn-helix domain-containing protein [Flavitalea sp. BT771]